MRQYEPIWIKLKSLSKSEAETIGVSIAAPRVLHKRIIKAVTKEKYMDFAYKAVNPREATLVHVRSNSILTFKLVFDFIPEDF
jgi:hypothetical protein